ncbi:pilus assembly protein, partial [Candidatus Roizmanbacteria bacterium CG03_land_8_20_14_0_80_39_12]
MKQMRNKKGFTLIELLLAMALMAILIVVFIASFNVTLKRGRDQRRKNDL